MRSPNQHDEVAERIDRGPGGRRGDPRRGRQLRADHASGEGGGGRSARQPGSDAASRCERPPRTAPSPTCCAASANFTSAESSTRSGCDFDRRARGTAVRTVVHRHPPPTGRCSCGWPCAATCWACSWSPRRWPGPATRSPSGSWPAPTSRTFRDRWRCGAEWEQAGIAADCFDGMPTEADLAAARERLGKL